MLVGLLRRVALPLPRLPSVFSLTTRRWRHFDGQTRGVDAGAVEGALKLAEEARDSWTVKRTAFLSPLCLRAVRQEIEKLSEVSAVAYGGYPHAERCRMLVMREELMETHLNDLESIGDVVPVKVMGDFLLVKADQADFLVAFIGIGLKAEDFGDILLEGESGCLVFTSPEKASTLEEKLKAVRSVSVKAKSVTHSDIAIPPCHVKDIRTVEASLRLDAVASAAFGVAREKIAERIKQGDVQVNWEVVTKPTLSVEKGDVISCSGKGKAEIKSVRSTKKMKFSVHLIRQS